MVLNRFRHLLPRFIDKPVNFCIKHNITPNQITLFGTFVSGIAAIMLAFPETFFYNYYEFNEKFWWWWACIPGWFFFIGAYIDALDGSVARKTGKVSDFGGFFDSTLDRFSDAIVLLGLMFSGMIWYGETEIDYLFGFIALSVILLISYTRSRAEIEGVIMKGIGFMERAERVFYILIAIVIEWAVYSIQTQFYGYNSSNYTSVFPILFLIYIILCSQTLYARIKFTYKWLTGILTNEEKKKIAESVKNPESKKSEESEQVKETKELKEDG